MFERSLLHLSGIAGSAIVWFAKRAGELSNRGPGVGLGGAVTADRRGAHRALSETLPVTDGPGVVG